MSLWSLEPRCSQGQDSGFPIRMTSWIGASMRLKLRSTRHQETTNGFNRGSEVPQLSNISNQLGTAAAPCRSTWRCSLGVAVCASSRAVRNLHSLFVDIFAEASPLEARRHLVSVCQKVFKNKAWRPQDGTESIGNWECSERSHVTTIPKVVEAVISAYHAKGPGAATTTGRLPTSTARTQRVQKHQHSGPATTL